MSGDGKVRPITIALPDSLTEGAVHRVIRTAIREVDALERDLGELVKPKLFNAYICPECRLSTLINHAAECEGHR